MLYRGMSYEVPRPDDATGDGLTKNVAIAVGSA